MTFVKRVAGPAALGVATLIGSGLSAPPAQAGYVVTLTQQGSNVVATGSGILDLTGLSLTITGDTSQAGIFPAGGLINTGPTTATPVDLYTGTTGPTSFGSGSFLPASSGSGDPVNIQGSIDNLVVPAGYVSDSRTLSDTSTYSGQTFASLGVTPGTYEWTWGTGADQNFTLQIGPAAVPAPLIGHGLPALLAVCGLLVGAKLFGHCKRHRAQFA
jgi:hypothetical protein